MAAKKPVFTIKHINCIYLDTGDLLHIQSQNRQIYNYISPHFFQHGQHKILSTTVYIQVGIYHENLKARLDLQSGQQAEISNKWICTYLIQVH